MRNFAADHSDELDKLYDELPTDSAVTVYVRLATPDVGATEDLSEKFGASIEEAVGLLQSIQKSKFAPAISFHVGS